LAGERPFRGNRAMLLHQAIHDEAPSPRQFNGSVPQDLATICLKCLEKEPDQRYATCHDLSADLRRFTNGEPPLSRPVVPLRRFWRWYRHRVLAVAAAAAILASVFNAVLGVATMASILIISLVAGLTGGIGALYTLFILLGLVIWLPASLGIWAGFAV